MHLDKTFWGLPWRPHEAGPTTLERIENERRLRRELQLPADVQAERLVRQAMSRGTVHIRTHVDVDTEIGLRNFEGVMAARSRLRTRSRSRSWRSRRAAWSPARAPRSCSSAR